MKPGRNDPCPCGSGKKHKHCCLATAAAALQAPQELAWRHIRRELEDFGARILTFITSTYGDVAVDEAWAEFLLWRDDAETFEPETPHLPVFMPWFFHRWTPDPEESRVSDAQLHNVAPTRAFLAQKGARLDPALREYLQSCLDNPFSFFEIEHVDQGRGLALRDVLTGESHNVQERAASQTLRRGDILYAQLASALDITLLEGVGPVAFPPADKVELIEMRKKIGRAERADDIHNEWDFELREIYQRRSEALLYPQRPTLRVIDGDLVEFHKLVYAIDSADDAFDALKDLAGVHVTQAELLEQAQRHADGRLLRARIVWTRDALQPEQGNTILGELNIEDGRLVAEVNSRARADTLRDLIAGRLGDRAQFQLDEIQSVEALWDRISGEDPKPDDDVLAMSESPEILALVAEVLQRHYEAWIDTALPVLNGRTPREAIRDAHGREQVEALIVQMERNDETRHAETPALYRKMREQLGLDEDASSRAIARIAPRNG